VPHRSGAVARQGVVDGRGVIEVVSASDGQSQLLGLLPGVEFHDPVWVDTQMLVAVGQSDDGDALYAVHTGHPLLALRLDSSVFEGATELSQVAVVDRQGPMRLVATAGSFPRKLYRLDASTTLGALFDEPPRAAELTDDGVDDEAGGGSGDPQDVVEEIHAEFEEAQLDGESTEAQADDGMPELVELDTNAFSTVALTTAGRAFDPAVSPDGAWVVVALRDRDLDRPDASEDSEIAIAPVADVGAGKSKLRLLTRNALGDHTPRFTSDGAWVVFQTTVEIPRTDWTVTMARRARVVADAAGTR
jgi:hypothetical protein